MAIVQCFVFDHFVIGYLGSRVNDEKYDAKSDSLLEILNYVRQIGALRDSDDKIEENMFKILPL